MKFINRIKKIVRIVQSYVTRTNASFLREIPQNIYLKNYYLYQNIFNFRYFFNKYNSIVYI